MENFKGQCTKDNFHNPFFNIDKGYILCTIDSTILINFPFPKGVVNGERPLKLELDITLSFRNINPFVDQYSICFNRILKAF
jgi:hypothetical protein